MLLHVLAIAVVMALGSPAFGQAGDDGYIEVRGSEIDGAEVFVGRTSMGLVKDGELLIRSLAPARYVLRVELSGFFPREFEVEVEAGLVTAVQIGAMSPSIETVIDSSLLANASLVSTSASLALMCFPMACELTVLEAPDSLFSAAIGTPGAGADAAAEALVIRRGFGDATLRVRGLPEGAYRFRVAGERGETEVATGMCHGETLGMFVDFSGRLLEVVVTESAYPNCPALPPRSADDAAR